jgi:hypothetical protein
MNSSSQCIGKNCSFPTLLFNNKKYSLSLCARFLSLSLQHAPQFLSLSLSPISSLATATAEPTDEPKPPDHQRVPPRRSVLSPPQPAHDLADDPPLQHVPAAGHTPHGSQPFKIKQPINSNLLHVGTHHITTNQPSTTNKNPIQTQHPIPPETTTKIHIKKKSPISPNAPSPGIPNTPPRLHLPASTSSPRRERRE